MVQLLYIAAPYTHPDPVHNTNRVIKVADLIYASGEWVPVIPHLSLLWHAIVPHTHDFWCQYDLHLLSACNAIVRLPGMSEGGDFEVQEASRLRIPQIAFAQLPLNVRKAWTTTFVEPDH